MSSHPVVTPEQLLAHWQGHRRVTRRLVEVFPERELFDYAIGGMRPFAKLATELLTMAVPIAQGVATGQWVNEKLEVTTKGEILRLWDANTAELDRVWKTIPEKRFQEEDTAFGQWKMSGFAMIFYAIDNEVHHRGQGYVYLRSLGFEPPAFYDRS
jgi:uncharacterized damage-inducible protein DinB